MYYFICPKYIKLYLTCVVQEQSQTSMSYTLSQVLKDVPPRTITNFAILMQVIEKFSNCECLFRFIQQTSSGVFVKVEQSIVVKATGSGRWGRWLFRNGDRPKWIVPSLKCQFINFISQYSLYPKEPFESVTPAYVTKYNIYHVATFYSDNYYFTRKAFDYVMILLIYSSYFNLP